MLLQLVYDALIVMLTVIVQASFIGSATSILNRAGHWFTKPPLLLKLLIPLVALVLWLVAGLSISA